MVLGMAELVPGDLPEISRMKYPWREWEDGRTRKLKQGVDFQDLSRLRGAASARAKQMGSLSRIRKVSDDEVLLQFVPVKVRTSAKPKPRPRKR
jgi:hypothetical protein